MLVVDREIFQKVAGERAKAQDEEDRVPITDVDIAKIPWPQILILLAIWNPQNIFVSQLGLKMEVKFLFPLFSYLPLQDNTISQVSL